MEIHSSALSQYLADLERKYLPVANRETGDAVDFETKAYSVLAHAAFEQFFEDVAVDFGERLLNHWQSNKLMDRELITCIGCIVSGDGNFLCLETDESKRQEAPIHQLSKTLRKRVTLLRNAIDDNNGISLKFLRNMFAPLGINIDLDPDTQSGLTLIARNRGTFAHRRTPKTSGKFAHKPVSASDIVQYVTLVMKYCEQFESKIIDMFQDRNVLFRSEIRQQLFRELRRALKTIAGTKLKHSQLSRL